MSVMDVQTSLSANQIDRILAGYAALAIVVHILEASFPSPIPGFKPGLANILTLLALLRFGWRAAVTVALLRIIVGSLLIGSFLTPGFVLSLSGGLCSLAVLGLGMAFNAHCERWKLSTGIRLSVFGLAVLAAYAHMAGQFSAAMLLFIPHTGLLNLLPVLLTAALVFGCISGWISQQVLKRLPPTPAIDATTTPSATPVHR